MTIKIECVVVDPALREFGLPKYETLHSAGMDLRAMLDVDSTMIQPGAVKLIPTGIRLNMDCSNMCAHVLPRSGLGHKRGLVLGNLVGLIDADYTDQLYVSMWNRGDEGQVITCGDRIAQLVFMPIIRAELVEVDAFNTEGRGGGFGSTGVS